MRRFCRTCKGLFETDEDWKTECLDCWKRRRRERDRRENETWQQQRSRRQETPADLLERQIRRFAQDVYAQARKLDERELEQRYQAGYAAGFDDGAAGAGGLDPAFLRDLVALCHPDRHPGRVEKATRVTQRLLEMVERAKTRRAA